MLFFEYIVVPLVYIERILISVSIRSDNRTVEINTFNAILTTKHPQRESKFAEYAHLGQTLKFFEGEAVAKCCKGDEDLYLYYIVSGSIRVRYQRSDDSLLELFYRDKGNIFQSEFNQFASICTDKLKIIAKQNTIVSAFTKRQLYELLQNDQELFDEFLFTIHLTYATLAHRIINTAYLSSSEKILNWLGKLCSVNEPDMQGCYKLPCELTQQQIADLLFIHVTTCNKLFSFLERDHLAKKTKSHIIVYNWQTLQEFLEDEKILCSEAQNLKKMKKQYVIK